MANFKTTIITKKGHALMAKLSANVATMKFTKVCSSDFDYSNLNNSELEQVITFKNLKQTVLPDLITVVNTTTVKVSATITNTNLSEGYYLRTIGLFALDPDDGEILYSITPTTEADYMAADNGITKSGISLDLLTTISNSENVSLEVDPNAMISAETFNNVVGNVSDLENGGTNLVDGINKNTARLNALANPSILINGDFRNPVNQRKTESISSTGTSVEGYFIDRWLCLVNGQGNSVVKNEGFISLIGKKGTSCSQCRQFVEFPKMYRGKNVAISFKYRVSKGRDKNNVRIYSNVKGIDNPWIFNDTLIPDGEWHIYNKILSIPNSDSITGFAPIWISCINIDFNTSQEYPLTEDCQIDVEWVKSEIGNKVTPFVPRLYGEELALCRRYGIGFTNERPRFRADAVNGNQIIFFIPLTTMLRIAPTITDCFSINSLNGSAIEGFTFTVVNCPNGIIVNANKTSHGMSDGHLMIKDNAFIDSEIH